MGWKERPPIREKKNGRAEGYKKRGKQKERKKEKGLKIENAKKNWRKWIKKCEKKWEIGQKEKAKLNMWRILKEVKKKLSWKKKWLNKKAIEKNY